MGIKLKRKKKGGGTGRTSRYTASERSDHSTWQSPSEQGYPGTAEYIDTRGTFSRSMSRSAENISGTATSGRTTAKYGDPNFPEIAYLSGDKSFKGGTWDRSGRTFTPGKQSYTPTRTPSGRGYTYSMEAIREV